MRHLIFIIITVFFSAQTIAQIEIGSKNEKDRKKEQKMKDDVEKEIEKKKKKLELNITGRNVYIGISPGQSYRQLYPAKTIFSRPIEHENSEKPIFSMRVSAGMQVTIFKHLMLDFGFTYMHQGESYSFKDQGTDSTMDYTNKYRYIGVPLTANGIFGNDRIRFYFGAGIIPMMLVNQYEYIRYTTEEGTISETSRSFRDTRFNQFNIQAIGKLGMQVNLTKHLGFYLAPEFRLNLMNTFQKQHKHIHKQYAWGADFGLLILL